MAILEFLEITKRSSGSRRRVTGIDIGVIVIVVGVVIFARKETRQH